MNLFAKHKIIEKNATLLLVLSFLVVSVGGIVEIAPLFYLESTIEKVEGVRPYSPPDLTDAIWLYGSDPDSVRETISTGPDGIMPAWLDKLTEAELRKVAVYVHQLGGGE
jgi:cbb3-type cytochrome oxidase subunit FixO-like protein